MTLDPLQEASRRIAYAQVELEAKGYASGLVSAALSRASGSAQFKVRDVQDSGVKNVAYLDTLTAEIGRAEAWIRKQQEFLDGLSDNSSQEGGD